MRKLPKFLQPRGEPMQIGQPQPGSPAYEEARDARIHERFDYIEGLLEGTLVMDIDFSALDPDDLVTQLTELNPKLKPEVLKKLPREQLEKMLNNLLAGGAEPSSSGLVDKLKDAKDVVTGKAEVVSTEEPPPPPASSSSRSRSSTPAPKPKPSEDTEYPCELCRKEGKNRRPFKTLEGLENHIAREHGTSSTNNKGWLNRLGLKPDQ